MTRARTERITAVVSPAAHETVAEFLRLRCGGAILLEDGETLAATPTARPFDGGAVRLTAHCDAEAAADTVFALHRLVAHLRDAGLQEGSAEVLLESDEELGWEQPLRAIRIPGAYTIVPPWLDPPPDGDELAIRLDAAGAFGDGRHPSTALALLQLGRLRRSEPAPSRILDIGCGSGVLTLAAALTWPEAQVSAVDTAEVAVRATRLNADRLGLADRVTVRAGSVETLDDGPDGAPTYALVLANLSVGILQRMAHRISPLVDRGGKLVMSGFQLGARDGLERQFAGLGLFPIAADDLEGWAALTVAPR